MQSLRNDALTLASWGFHIFPLPPGKKFPPIKAFTDRATTDTTWINKWWGPYGNPRNNIGIATDKFSEGKSLVVIDVDLKKKGPDSLKKLKLLGYAFPNTYQVKTQNGGRHLYYWAEKAIRGGVDCFGEDFPGVDIRSGGQYVVGAFSFGYEKDEQGTSVSAMSRCPQWIIDKRGDASLKEKVIDICEFQEDIASAEHRAIEYLKAAPVAVQGQGGDEQTFKVAATLKDFGVTQKVAFELMSEFWNEKCQPPWGDEALEAKVSNAYQYGRDKPGTKSPELEFENVHIPTKDIVKASKPKKKFKPEDTSGPVESLNKEFAFLAGGSAGIVLWETKDAEGKPYVKHLSMDAFHNMLLPNKIVGGNGKLVPISKVWLNSPARRTYENIVFKPQNAPLKNPRLYNLWKGFPEHSVKDEIAAKDGVAAFKEHMLENICQKDEGLYVWLWSYFAHIIQKPGEKPLTALVFRGDKGVGKNALIRIIGELLGSYYLLTSDRRYLVGNFNAHMENRLLFVLDEAFWSGDKQAEGRLKDLITGDRHVIERKGKEMYEVDNFTRVVIIGNEDWLVPASFDERRFAVFDVGDGRKQDTHYFRTMRKNMELGGYCHLFEELLQHDLSEAEKEGLWNKAPSNDALLVQKLNSLGPFEQWWQGSLHDGNILGMPFTEGEWLYFVATSNLRSAFQTYCKEHNIRSRISNPRIFSKHLKKVCPKAVKSRRGTPQLWGYAFPDLEECRALWEKRIGHKEKWGED